MFNGEEKQSLNDLDMDDVEESVGGHAVEGSETDGAATEGGANRGSSGLAERLTEILVEDGDGDLLLQRSDREGSVLQWLQALDMQVMGACRADERLKPLLKMNVSTGAAEDCLLAYLSQVRVRICRFRRFSPAKLRYGLGSNWLLLFCRISLHLMPILSCLVVFYRS